MSNSLFCGFCGPGYCRTCNKIERTGRCCVKVNGVVCNKDAYGANPYHYMVFYCKDHAEGTVGLSFEEMVFISSYISMKREAI